MRNLFPRWPIKRVCKPIREKLLQSNRRRLNEIRRWFLAIVGPLLEPCFGRFRRKRLLVLI
jgi:hypothetical protein